LHDGASLSDRQREVASLIAAGMSNRAIAARLGLGRRTVDTHVRHILRKLGLRSRVQIGVWLVTRSRR
jgi:non-specific serine/threonine protein kinase